MNNEYKGKAERFNSFKYECMKVAKAYDLTLEQYLDVTLNKRVIDHEEGVDFDQVFNWNERYEFLHMIEDER